MRDCLDGAGQTLNVPLSLQVLESLRNNRLTHFLNHRFLSMSLALSLLTTAVMALGASTPKQCDSGHIHLFSSGVLYRNSLMDHIERAAAC